MKYYDTDDTAQCCGYFEHSGRISWPRLPTYRCEVCRGENMIPYRTAYTGKPVLDDRRPWTWCGRCDEPRRWHVVHFGLEEVALVLLQSAYRAVSAYREFARLRALKRALQKYRWLAEKRFVVVNVDQGDSQQATPSVNGDRCDSQHATTSGKAIDSALDFTGAMEILTQLPDTLFRQVLVMCCSAPPIERTSEASGAGIRKRV
eukprot:GEMP01087772.1.p1 GENE.GEMP01087772.1~~GEMP01087772.1.p1  ORF type:complete len:204 (+),score=26.15 GEMP01087772.1:148-759(+)